MAPQAGAVCDFTDQDEITRAIVHVLGRKASVSEEMRRLHREKFNYAKGMAAIGKLIENA